MPHFGFVAWAFTLCARQNELALASLTVGQIAQVPAQMPLPAMAQSDTFTCDIDTTGPICLGTGQQVLLPPVVPFGLVGHWSFDESRTLDSSGSNIHGVNTVQAGPSFGGQGNSASFHKSFLVIPAANQLHLKEFSYTFWVYLIEDSTSTPQQGLRYCPLVRKGLDTTGHVDMGYAQQYNAAPAILLDRETRQLRVELTTDIGASGAGEAFQTNARLSRGRWFHISLVRFNLERRVRLYVNGVLDSSVSTQGSTKLNHEPLFVGSDPVVADQCSVPMYIDELKIYNRPLSPDEIAAEAAVALAGVEPSFVRLSCISCPLEIAMQNCPEGYHICNSLELHMGGYQVARTLGWLQKGAHVWSHAPVANPSIQAAAAPGMSQVAASPAAAPWSYMQIGSEQIPGGLNGASPVGLGLCCSDA